MRSRTSARARVYHRHPLTSGDHLPIALREVAETLLPVVLVFLALTLMFLVIRRTGRRFEAEQIRNGRWDKNGPLHPTATPERYRRGSATLHLNLGDDDDAPVAFDSLPRLVDETTAQPPSSLLAHEYHHPRPRKKED